MLKRALSLSMSLLLLAPALAGAADTPQPPIDRAALKSTYQPNGFYKPGDPIPALATDLPMADAQGLFNPSGHWSAYDTDIYETLNFPLRQANDASNTDPLGSGDPRHGWCPPDPLQPGFIPGRCANHAAEYRDFFERTMKQVLGDFGVTVKRYPFNTGEDQPPVGLPGGLTSRQGDSVNMMAIVPGADHPDEIVLVGAHYDQTDGGPASAWDSAEGHASIIRMAAIMADYWRKTGTRPSATVAFVPWDQEENGSLGSRAWLQNNVPPATEYKKIRAYFNDDPCATGYPAYYHGNPAVQVPIVLQLTDPAEAEDKERLEAFNKLAEQNIDDFFADIDDEVDTIAGPMPVFIDSQRSQVVTALGGLLAFGSDYSNFEAVGVPIMNLFPDILGPHADGSPGFSAEGVSILHTPRDNVPTWNGFTDSDQTGLTGSDGWQTGMEMCSQLYARMMLRPSLSGTQAANMDPVAYFEALPNAVPKGKLVTMDASGSYQYASIATRERVAEADLQFAWDFNDGSAAAFGRVVKHAYGQQGVYQAKLTVTNRKTRAAKSMTVPITVEDADAGSETDPAGQTSDPGLLPAGAVVTCQGSQLGGVKLTPSGRGLKIDAAGKPVRVEILQAGGRKAKKIADLAINGSGSWNGKGGAATATYVVRVTFRGTTARADSISRAFERRGGKLKARKAFQLPDSCGPVSVFRLTTPRFGANAKLGIAVTLTKTAVVRLDVYKGKKRVAGFRRTAHANRLLKVVVSGRKLRKGEYRVVLRLGKVKRTLYTRRG